MKIRSLFLLCLACVFTSNASAQPTLNVVDGGINASSNREWIVQVAPDASLFSSAAGGSLAVELGFNVTTGSLVSATPNSGLWPFDNPGDNPFTTTITDGVTTDTGANTVFSALGSDLFTTGTPVDVLTIETAGTGTTTLMWGGQTVLPGTSFEFVGSRIAQNGANYDNYAGSLTLGGGLACDLDGNGQCDLLDIELLVDDVVAGSAVAGDIATWLADASSPANPYLGGAKTFVIGDADLDGKVDSIDLGLLLNNFNSTTTSNWMQGNLNGDGVVDSIDLGQLLNNFNFSSAASAAAVPEPSSLGLFLLATLGMIGCGRRKRQS